MGKYMNGYDDFTNHTFRPNVPNDPGLHKPKGWDYWLGMLRNKYYGPTFSLDGNEISKLPPDVYQTDYLNEQAIDFLRNKRDPDRPFFIMVLPFAPHAPADPAPRHKDLYRDVRIPRTPRFNPNNTIMEQKGTWIKGMPELLDEQIDDLDEFYRKRLRSLRAVDESLRNISDVLDELGLAENTYFMYVSDNGQHFGDYRIPAGKRQAYETDILVPFFVRGPGIEPNTSSAQLLQNIDLAPTFMEIATATTTATATVTANGDGRDDGLERRRRRKLTSTYEMDGKSFFPLMTKDTAPATEAAAAATQEVDTEVSAYNDHRWAALAELSSGSSGYKHKRYTELEGYWIRKMVRS
jgi:arylsulfatase A-like enzyme